MQDSYEWGAFRHRQEVPSTMPVWRSDLNFVPGFMKNEEGEQMFGPWLSAPGYFAGYSVTGGRLVSPWTDSALRSRRGLHRDFAQLTDRHEQARFAKRHGLLGHGAWFFEEKNAPNAFTYGESAESWKIEIRRMRATLAAWDAAHNTGLRSSVASVAWSPEGAQVHIQGIGGRPSAPPWLQEQWKRGEWRAPLRYAVCGVVNEYLGEHISPVLLTLEGGPTLRNVPDCLLGALWASFSCEITGILPAAKGCAAPDCNNQYVPGTSHGRYCSKRCYQRVLMRERRQKEREARDG